PESLSCQQRVCVALGDAAAAMASVTRVKAPRVKKDKKKGKAKGRREVPRDIVAEQVFACLRLAKALPVTQGMCL
ncbi:hypothetical protein KIPB_014717, partial [Kipferlia bialata]